MIYILLFVITLSTGEKGDTVAYPFRDQISCEVSKALAVEAIEAKGHHIWASCYPLTMK